MTQTCDDTLTETLTETLSAIRVERATACQTLGAIRPIMANNLASAASGMPSSIEVSELIVEAETYLHLLAETFESLVARGYRKRSELPTLARRLLATPVDVDALPWSPAVPLLDPPVEEKEEVGAALVAYRAKKNDRGV